MSEISKRILTASVALLLLGAILYLNGMVLKVFVFLAALVSVYEFSRAFVNKGHASRFSFSAAYLSFFLLSIVSMQFVGKEHKSDFLLFGLTLTLAFFLLSMILRLAKDKENLSGIAIDLMSVFYIALPAGMLILLSESKYLYLILIIAFSSDSFALFAGKAFGKRKLAPKISPNKTVAGALGAISGSIFTLFLARYFYFDFLSYADVILLGFFGSIFAQAGDLTASLLKRYCEIKDFGKLMPGHGGILDRLDSIIFVTPLVYLLYLFHSAPVFLQCVR